MKARKTLIMNTITTETQQEYELGSMQWFENLKERAEAMGNSLAIQNDLDDMESFYLYQRRRSLKSSPFSRRNLYDEDTVRYGGKTLQFWRNVPNQKEWARRLQKQIEVDELIYAKWLELDKPWTSEHLITLKEVL